MQSTRNALRANPVQAIQQYAKSSKHAQCDTTTIQLTYIQQTYNLQTTTSTTCTCLHYDNFNAATIHLPIHYRFDNICFTSNGSHLAVDPAAPHTHRYYPTVTTILFRYYTTRQRWFDTLLGCSLIIRTDTTSPLLLYSSDIIPLASGGSTPC